MGVLITRPLHQARNYNIVHVLEARMLVRVVVVITLCKTRLLLLLLLLLMLLLLLS